MSEYQTDCRIRDLMHDLDWARRERDEARAQLAAAEAQVACLREALLEVWDWCGTADGVRALPLEPPWAGRVHAALAHVPAEAATLRAELSAFQSQVAALREALERLSDPTPMYLWHESVPPGDGELLERRRFARAALVHGPAPPPAVPAGLLCFCLSCGHEDRRRELTIPTPCPACEAPRLWTVATVAMELRQRPPAGPDALALAAGRYREAVAAKRALCDKTDPPDNEIRERQAARGSLDDAQAALLQAALEQEPR